MIYPNGVCILDIALSFSPTRIIKVKDLCKRNILPKIMHSEGQNLARNPAFLEIIFPVGSMSIASSEEVAWLVSAEWFSNISQQNKILNSLLSIRAMGIEKQGLLLGRSIFWYGTFYVTQAGLKLTILLPQDPKCWHYRSTPQAWLFTGLYLSHLPAEHRRKQRRDTKGTFRTTPCWLLQLTVCQAH